MFVIPKKGAERGARQEFAIMGGAYNSPSCVRRVLDNSGDRELMPFGGLCAGRSG